MAGYSTLMARETHAGKTPKTGSRAWWRSNIKEAGIPDLRLLNLYARSRPTGGRASIDDVIGKFKEHGVAGSKDAAIAAIARLEREYDVVVIQRRPTIGARGPDVATNPSIDEHFEHPEDFRDFKPPEYGSRRKARLTLDGEIVAEVASLFCLYEAIAIGATARTKTPRTLRRRSRKGELREPGKKLRPEPEDRKAVLGWLRTERRRLQALMQQLRSPAGSVFDLRSSASDDGLGDHPLDTVLVELDTLPAYGPVGDAEPDPE